MIKDTALFKGLEGLSTKDMAKVFAERLKSGVIDGKSLNINGRIWGVKHYTRMLARTTASTAHTAGVLNAMEQSGVDLVRVSTHNTDTPICKKYEGNIYSVSGRSKKYPKLDAKAPFHPGCKHVMSPYVDLEDLKAA